MGNSTNVPLAQRVSTWIETVPRLLAHVGIQHVSLVSHSSGTMYLLNTLYHCRDILYPEKPMATMLGMLQFQQITLSLLCTFSHWMGILQQKFSGSNQKIAPWVDPAKSGMTSLRMAQYIPAPAFKLLHHIPRLFLANDGSATATSGAIIASLTASFPSKSGDNQAKNSLYIAQNYELDVDQQKEISSSMMQGMFKEETVGSNSEALLCLRKEPNIWGQCEDYEVFVREVVERERARDGAPLKVYAFFAESDSLIGKKGQAYVEKCWHQVNDGDSRGVVEFDSRVVLGTDHDSLVPCAEAWESIFKRMQGVEGDGSI